MSYLDNARAFLKEIGCELDGVFGSDLITSYVRIVKAYNAIHGTHYTIYNGAVRVVIAGDDFVVKVDYNKNNAKSFGGCVAEYKKYRQAKEDGYAYLLAEVTKMKGGHHYYYVMPRVDYLGADSEESFEDYFNDEELDWLCSEVGDLHEYNYGFLDGECYIIDYACR